MKSILPSSAVCVLLSGCITVTTPETETPDTTSSNGNTAPTISGFPTTNVEVNSSYDFIPSTIDKDGDTLTYIIANKPEWALFDETTGRLHGTPTQSGSYESIVISVSDGESTTSLNAFDITVTPAEGRSIFISWLAPNTYIDGKPLTDIQGYVIHLGRISGQYHKEIEVKNASATGHTIHDLETGDHFFTIVAKTSQGLVSDFSNEMYININ